MLVHPTQLALSSATLSNERFCSSFLIKDHVVCVPSTTAKWTSFLNYNNRKDVGGKHNIKALYVDATAPDPAGAVLCNPFKWDILLFILIGNHVVCVPSTTAKWITFLNHRFRKVVGGKHKVLILYVDFVHPTHLVLSSATLSNEIFCCSF